MCRRERMTNLLASMDERLTGHFRSAGIKRIILIVLAHFPLLVFLLLGHSSTVPHRWALVFSIVLAIICDIILLVDRILHHTLIRLFRPEPPGPPFRHEDFEKLSYTSSDGTEMPMWHHDEKGEGLAVFLHGWTSCSHYQLERMRALWATGWSTVTLDLRGHGEAPPTRIFSSVQAAMDVHCAIAELHSATLIDQRETLLIHGHSLGAYVAQHVLKTWESKHGSRPRVILESPLIDLPLIIIHKAPLMRILLPLIMRRIASLTQIIEPTSPPWSPKSFGPPEWGSFEGEKILFIQAGVDRTLGPAQAEAAKLAYPWLKVHTIDNLRHSARESNPSRDSVILDWLTGHSDSDSM